MEPDEERNSANTDQRREPAVQAERAAEAEALKQELEKQKQLAEHNLDQWRRSAADLQNYRKRVEKERAELLKFGPAPLMSMLLSVLDDLERALQTCPEACLRLTWTEGVALIERKLRLILEQHGMEEIKALGKLFDPARHEALLQEESSAYPDGHVSQVVQKGYLLYDRVLRPAIVKVARKKPGLEGIDATEPRLNAPDQVQSPSAEEENQSEKEQSTNNSFLGGKA